MINEMKEKERPILFSMYEAYLLKHILMRAQEGLAYSSSLSKGELNEHREHVKRMLKKTLKRLKKYEKTVNN